MRLCRYQRAFVSQNGREQLSLPLNCPTTHLTNQGHQESGNGNLDLGHGARSREKWHSPRSKNLVVIKQFFLQFLFIIYLCDYKTGKIDAKSVLVS